MDHAITGRFATRRDAELAVERLVQEHGIERADILVQPAGDANTAGTKVSGGDSEVAQQDAGKSGEPKLSGAIEVSVKCAEDKATLVKAAFGKAGAQEAS